MDYTRTQPYRLGKLYKELGERLMDPMTDLRDLVALAENLGCKIGITFAEPESEPTPEAAKELP